MRKAPMMVYVSSAETRRIAVLQMDRETGNLTPLATVPVPETLAPSYQNLPLAVSPDRSRLYAAVRSEPYPIASFAIDPQNGALSLLGTGRLPDSMAYISTDSTGRYLLSASMGGHKVSVNPIDHEGILRDPASQVLPTRPNAHSVLPSPSNRFAYAALLGADVVLQLRFDPTRGALSPNEPETVEFPQGSGPRHMAFHPMGGFLYLLTEHEGAVHVLSLDDKTGLLKEIQSVTIMPPGSAAKARAADIHLTPDGRFLYASARSRSIIASFAVDAVSGRISPLGFIDCETSPRSFAIDPSGRFLICLGQVADRIGVYAIDQADGALRPVQQIAQGGNIAWVEIVDLAAETAA